MYCKIYYVYLLTNTTNTVIYTGVTSSLLGRVGQHKLRKIKGFTTKYHISKLVYYEEYPVPYEAIYREKQIKNWKRRWKLDLIEKNNPNYDDLSVSWYN